eukprot:CAMPEP_0201140974 /NCGR_PEP_ID=MMETSP0851-20130426/2585_1 /ASSEMBLY_ACC=CAM_ASM_000631 /TAXON_ID=183588 /ORGANISM="Pseudo-nitzschia fraudulenta, Strain WWA7" /LENGTH=319 /DNA_ID=CAMNT_0047413825 /DNA_START=340 /DNA_END=1299 /DNA_ORIENTATION=-
MVFNELIKEAKASSSSLPKKIHFMEVGMHHAAQCIRAAKAGMISLCVEPSPKSTRRIQNGIDENAPEEYRKNIRFYQLAGSETSGKDLEFLSEGGTGDHVGGGGLDFWTMTKSEPTPVSKSNTVTVKSVAIDDILQNKIEPTIDYGMKLNGKISDESIDSLYLLKLDVQANEASVLAGLKESIRGGKIDLILMEYWPKGLDFLHNNLGTDRECKVPVRLLQTIADAGYTLYATGAQSHPAAPEDKATYIVRSYNQASATDHLKSFEDHCKWFYELEKNRSMNKDGTMYEMGWWTDILAVKSGFKFPNPPTTSLGKFLME